MRTEDFHFDLPESLIASRPAPRRDGSRMLVVHRESGRIEHRRFAEIETFLRPEDLVVLNDTRVVAARFFDNKGRIELLRTEILPDGRWCCMVRPGKRLKVGRTVAIGEATGTVEAIREDGQRILSFDRPVDSDALGHLALPPYIERPDDDTDRERYQTVFASREGAIAAPTAGLHFTPELLERLRHVFLTLHVGAGTFLPVKAEEIEDHRMHTERFEVSGETVAAIEKALDSQGRVVAVGTTVVRVLEHLAAQARPLQAGSGETCIFVYPPYEFRVIGTLLTNFHLPCSTLLMLVSAFAGRELILEAYAKAVEERYRFYSYGDCMLIL